MYIFQFDMFSYGEIAQGERVGGGCKFINVYLLRIKNSICLLCKLPRQTECRALNKSHWYERQSEANVGGLEIDANSMGN